MPLNKLKKLGQPFNEESIAKDFYRQCAIHELLNSYVFSDYGGSYHLNKSFVILLPHRNTQFMHFYSGNREKRREEVSK